MALHLIKLCVGIEDVDHLAERQAFRLEQQRLRGEEPRLFHTTRMKPKRGAELLNGGSLYWVIRGMVRCRQPLIALDETTRSDGVSAVDLVVENRIVRVVPRAQRPFQGWRYLEPKDAPRDLSEADRAAEEIPSEMADELRTLGLL